MNAIGILVRIWFRFFVLVKVVYVLLCFEVGFFGFDTEAAQKDLRKRGKVLASKKSSRTAAEGMLAVAQNEGKVAVIELNCETDFVARNEIFQYLVSPIAISHWLLLNDGLFVYFTVPCLLKLTCLAGFSYGKTCFAG